MRPNRLARLAGWCAVAALLGWAAPPLARADDAIDAEEAEGDTSDQPIALELAQGIQLLADQITQQQQLLETAQTDREKQLIRNHIRSLQKERRSLEGLLQKLVGPNVDLLEAAREQQAETRSERQEKTLEKEDRRPQP